MYEVWYGTSPGAFPLDWTDNLTQSHFLRDDDLGRSRDNKRYAVAGPHLAADNTRRKGSSANGYQPRRLDRVDAYLRASCTAADEIFPLEGVCSRAQDRYYASHQR